jgi:hypothetical protein
MVTIADWLQAGASVVIAAWTAWTLKVLKRYTDETSALRRTAEQQQETAMAQHKTSIAQHQTALAQHETSFRTILLFEFQHQAEGQNQVIEKMLLRNLGQGPALNVISSGIQGKEADARYGLHHKDTLV